MPELFNIDEFCKDLPEVTSSKIKEKGKFSPHGLFSEQIFGPVTNYTCQCGKYSGPSSPVEKCDICGVEITSSIERRRRFAKIVLPLKVVNPTFYNLIAVTAGRVKSLLDTLMKDEKSVLYKEGDEYVVAQNAPPNVKVWERYEAMEELIRGLATYTVENSDPDVPIVKSWKFIKDNIDKMFIKNIIVLPPDLRPISKAGNDVQKADRINWFYNFILVKKEKMRDTMFDVNQNKALFYAYFKQLQKAVNELFDHIIEKLSKKEGLVRGNILGKRVDFSGRAVIVPKVTLNIDECGLPYFMLLEIYKMQIAKQLVGTTVKTLNEAIEYVDECIRMKSKDLLDVCEEVTKNEVCLLNRQPSLHRLSLVGFKIKVCLGDVIYLHPLVCSGFNADFDGDQMAVYIPLSPEAKQEVQEKLMITKNFSNPANASLSTLPNQDVVLGIYALTTNSFPNLRNLVECKGSLVTESMAIFNKCLPDDYPLVNRVVTKKELIEILTDIKEKYDPETVRVVLDEVKEKGFRYSTLFGASLSLQSCYVPDHEKVRDDLYSPSDVKEQIAKVSGKESETILREKFPYAYMVESGARGSWDQVRQIVLTRGFISNFKGQILKTPVKRSLLDGLTREEFFLSTFGCRKGLLDVALNTGASGYLSRKLVFTAANALVSETVEDCGTTDLLEVYVDSTKKAKMLVGRYYKDASGKLDKITKKNYAQFLGKTIFIRSPIFCRSLEFCHTCYGDLYKTLHSRFVGVIAAQSLGETNTQLILRTFHTSGVAVVKGEASLKQKDIVADLSAASKLLHQLEGVNYKDLVHDLFEVYNTSREIFSVHIEVIVSEMMWAGNVLWRMAKNRDKITPTYHSVQSVPARQSWLLGFAFSHPKWNLLRGVQYSGEYVGPIDKMLRGERI